MEEIWTEFIELYRKYIKRDGAEDLFNWLNESDFFTAPASTRYHLSEDGGLCRHSLHVYHRLKELCGLYYPEGECPFSDESIAIVSLLHDLCKVNFYKKGWRNQKNYDEEKVKAVPVKDKRHDAAGDFIWENVPTYEVDEKLIFGHGTKSVFIIMSYMKLTQEEAQAIRYHMSTWQEGDKLDVGKAYEQNKLALLLHFADEAATFIDE